MNLFQLISLFALIGFSVNQLLKLKNKPFLKILYGLRWFYVVVIAFVVIADPNISQPIAHVLGIARGADFIIYVSILWLLYKIYSQSQQITSLKEGIEKLVRHIALISKKDDRPKGK